MIHWNDGEMEKPTMACHRPLDPNRQDYREDPQLVTCPDCRWKWLVRKLSAIYHAVSR